MTKAPLPHISIDCTCASVRFYKEIPVFCFPAGKCTAVCVLLCSQCPQGVEFSIFSLRPLQVNNSPQAEVKYAAKREKTKEQSSSNLVTVFASAQTVMGPPGGGCPCRAGHQDARRPRSFHFHQLASFSAMACQRLRGRQVFPEAAWMICLAFKRKNKKSGERKGEEKFQHVISFFPLVELVLRKSCQD